jgi:hypothetical protein
VHKGVLAEVAKKPKDALQHVLVRILKNKEKQSQAERDNLKRSGQFTSMTDKVEGRDMPARTARGAA